jgi:hypothetical protein
MGQTPTCNKCGAKHYNFDSCPSMMGTLSAPPPPGFRRWHKTRAGGLAPVPDGARVWGDVLPFSHWQPKDDGPKAA